MNFESYLNENYEEDYLEHLVEWGEVDRISELANEYGEYIKNQKL